MRHTGNCRRILLAFYRFLRCFLLVAFVTTCCMMLFVSALSETLGVTLTKDNLAAAAKLTFWNVVLLSLLFGIADEIRRRLTVIRPVRRISEASQKMMKGDFSVRIPPRRYGCDDPFGEIIECFNKMAQELSGVETLRTDFVSNVSHEMKTPLSVMQNYATLLQSPDLSEQKRREYAKAIGENARRLSDMISNILKLNRLENQRIYPKAEVYDLGEQLCECLLGFENVWEARKIGIDTDIEESVTVCADAELLSIVWNNLFSNAFKFTGTGGTVSVSLSATEGFATVRVKDTGCGMSPQVGAHIFEKFYQGDPSHASQGNGLGLALVKRVVDIMRGEIDVESVPGEGTAFTVRIRRFADEHPEKSS